MISIVETHGYAPLHNKKERVMNLDQVLEALDLEALKESLKELEYIIKRISEPDNLMDMYNIEQIVFGAIIQLRRIIALIEEEKKE